MTAIADLLTRADRDRLLGRLAGRRPGRRHREDRDMTAMTKTARRAVNSRIRTLQRERKRVLSGFYLPWGVPFCKGPGSPFHQPPLCEGCGTREMLGADPDQVYAENWPRRAARLAADARARGDQPHADRLHVALVALMFRANCGRPLEDPASVSRGIGPDCWTRIDPQRRRAISGRLAAPDVLPEAS